MFLNSLVAYFALFTFCHGVTYDGCDLFDHRFMVKNGKFQDVCGSKTLNVVNGGSLNSNDQIYDFTGNNKITFTSEAFTGNRFAIVIEARRTVPKSSSSTSYGFDIILGPGGGNCQIRYEGPNKLGIYSYYKSYPTFYQSFALPDDVDKLHTLILYYSYGKLYVYQNNKLVKTITKSLDIGLGMMGGWYSSNPYYADIAIKNIMFAHNKGITDIKNYVYTCVALSGISTNNAMTGSEASNTDGLTAETEESASVINTAVILAFVAGMATMLVFIAFYGFYGCYKKRKTSHNDKGLNGAHVLQQIEMMDEQIDTNLCDDEIDEMEDDESKQITNTNQI